MKKEQREVYLELANVIDWSICPFCAYYKGGSSCRDDYWECNHPLEDKISFPSYDTTLAPGDDCWGYRRGLPIEDIADIVGMCLSQNYDTETVRFFWDKKNQLRIIGKIMAEQGAGAPVTQGDVKWHNDQPSPAGEYG